MLVEPILRSVPEWFGIEESTLAYVSASARVPTWAAFKTYPIAAPSEALGFVSISQHYPLSAEVHCMAVRRSWHRKGIGASLLLYCEDELRRAGVRYLQVKTQGPSLPCEQYARTTRFYEASGFVALEEVHGLWPGVPTLILVKSLGSWPSVLLR